MFCDVNVLTKIYFLLALLTEGWLAALTCGNLPPVSAG